MTPEDKELLLKDLSARLPYHVRLKVWLKDGTTEEGFLDLEHNYADVLRDSFYYNKIKDIKPYLRPMSSMTEKEREQLYFAIDFYGKIDKDGDIDASHHEFVFSETCMDYIDWLNAHHFDYRGLIKKGLALKAPEGMYNLNSK